MKQIVAIVFLSIAVVFLLQDDIGGVVSASNLTNNSTAAGNNSYTIVHENMTGHDHDHDHDLEHHPNNTTQSAVFDFQCKSETSIHLSESKLCDGNRDCPMDGSDEDEATCLLLLHKCLPGNHHCLNEERCVAHKQVCDGKNDCNNGWDESGNAGCAVVHMHSKNESNGYCSANHTACSPPYDRCIPDYAKCDYRNDCQMGEDETPCANGKRCPEGFFHCSRTSDYETKFYYHCIPNANVCNKKADCPNKEDESESSCRSAIDIDGHHHHDEHNYKSTAPASNIAFSILLIHLPLATLALLMSFKSI